MHINFEKGITNENISLLCEWSNEQGREFQEQWMGPRISYPLNCDKVNELKNIFSIFNKEYFIGVIQQIRIDKDNIHIGRFILDPQKTGFGLGTEALKGFLAFIFEDNDGELSS